MQYHAFSLMVFDRKRKEKGLIRDAKLFYFQEMFSEYKGELKPGVYELSTGMTPYEMMEIMSASDEEEE